MHFVLRSSHAKGDWSFRKPNHYARVDKILSHFANKHSITIRKSAIHLNHLHLHLKISSTKNYHRFIRAITSAIAMAVTGMSQWNKLLVKFWDFRPYSRPALSEAAQIKVDDYVRINNLEAIGYSRADAKWTVEQDRRWARKRGS
jgi:REP element-mobilizing transposase RayT